MNARRTPRFKPTILLPGRGIQALGALLLLLALVLPWWLVRQRTQEYAASSIEATGNQSGTIRPEMVLLPLSDLSTAGLRKDGISVEAQNAPVSRQAAPPTQTTPFAVATTEVTQGQYRRVMGRLPEASGNTALGAQSQCAQPTQEPPLPVVCVSFREALAYCNRLSRIEGLEPCYRFSGETAEWLRHDCLGYRLPTRAEWVYAATAGTGSRYAGTDDASALCRFANLSDSSVQSEALPCDDGYPGIAPAASLEPNRWFLYDMAGNVSEWVWLDEESVIDGKASATPGHAGLMGGNWQTEPSAATVSSSLKHAPARDGVKSPSVGFRIVRSMGK
jgi:sulfatase modifying factor 1